jgi:hypothetical protein
MNQIKKNEMGGHVARMGETRCTYRVLVGKRERRKPFEDVGEEGRMKLNEYLYMRYYPLCIYSTQSHSKNIKLLTRD